jgi:PAS domain S-box-containing protein
LTGLPWPMESASKPSNLLRVLTLEENPSDTERLRARMAGGGIDCEMVRVQTRAEFAAALDAGGFDLIIAGYDMPSFHGLSALECAREVRPDVPFILVSERIGEEAAIEIMKSGATDYVLKHRLERLVPAVRHAIRESEERRERARVEEALRESEERYRALVEYGSDIVTILEADGTMRYQSPSIERVLGYRPEELIGRNAFDKIHPEDIEPAQCAFAEFLSEGGATMRAEFRFRHADGSWRYIEGIGNDLLDDPSVRGIVVTFRDVTERKEAEEKHREAERRYRTLVEQIPAITYVQEPGEPSRTTYISPQYETVLGYSPHESLSDPEHWIKILYPADKERVLAEDRRTNETGEPFSMEYRQLAKDGRVVWIRDEATLVRDEEGSPSYWLGVQMDITERKRSESALRESEHRFRQLFEQSVDALFVHDEEGRLADCNVQACQSLGYTREELLKLSVKDIAINLLSEEERAANGGDALWERVLRGEPGRIVGFEENELRRKDGTTFPVEVGVGAIDYEGRHLIIASARDVSERKRAEEELLLSEERFRATFEQATVGVAHLGFDGRWLWVNDKLCEIVGYRRDELLKKTFQDITHPDDVEADLGYTRQLIAGDLGTYSMEKRCLKRDGSVVWVKSTVSLLRGASGEPSYTVAVIEDITERKHAEQGFRQSLDVLLALREAGQVLGSTLSSEEIGSRLLEIMRSVSRLTATVISVPDETGELRIWRSAGLEGLRRRARFKHEAEAARRAALEEEDQQLFRLHGSGVGEDYLVGLCLPLRAKDHVVGVLEAYGRESLADNDTMEILSSLASQAASALENARLYEQLEEREHALQDLVGKLLRAQEEERRRVAYEVHDGLAQVAVAAHQRLQAFARRHSPSTERGRRDLERILRLVRSTVSDARRIIANLRPTALDDLGLAAALAVEVEFLREDGYQVTFEENLGDERLPDKVEITLFRIGQEALTNVRKHAHTRRVRIRLGCGRDEAHLEIQDYGRGFDPGLAFGESGPGERVGLAGMRERVAMLGGEFTIRSHPDAGTSIAASVPLTRSP